MALAIHAAPDRRHGLRSGTAPRQPGPLTRVLVIHNTEIVRLGVSTLLSSGAPYEVASGASVFEGLRLGSALHPQVVLFEFAPQGGAEQCRLLAGMWPRPRLVALVSSSRQVPPRDCLAAGADAAIAIDLVSRESFLATVQRALAGDGPVVAGFRPTGQVAEEAVDDGPLSALTPREREILWLIGEGLSNREIADTLVLSVKTVETHRANLSTKLNVRPRAGLMRLALQGALS